MPALLKAITYEASERTKFSMTSADIRAFFPRLVYRLVEKKGDEKGATLMKSYSGRLRRPKTRAGEKAQGGGKRHGYPLISSSDRHFLKILLRNDRSDKDLDLGAQNGGHH